MMDDEGDDDDDHPPCHDKCCRGMVRVPSTN